jgi:hypothetical protein
MVYQEVEELLAIMSVYRTIVPSVVFGDGRFRSIPIFVSKGTFYNWIVFWSAYTLPSYHCWQITPPPFWGGGLLCLPILILLVHPSIHFMFGLTSPQSFYFYFLLGHQTGQGMKESCPCIAYSHILLYYLSVILL